MFIIIIVLLPFAPTYYVVANGRSIIIWIFFSNAIPNYYPPISTLSFLSKLTERIVLPRLNDYLSSNSLLTPHQSGFTKHHSTETLLVSLYNKLVSAVSHQQVSCLCLLDISAAFDTIDHNILLQRLSSWFGISGTALLWFKSYLSSRSFSVKASNHT